MILKVELWRTVSGKLDSYRVTHDTGVVRHYRLKDLPKSVRKFIEGHKAQTKTINDTVIKKVYVYDKIRVNNEERRE